MIVFKGWDDETPHFIFFFRSLLLLEEQLCQLVQTSAPGQEFMCRIGRYKGGGIEAGSFELIRGLGHTGRILLASATNEDACHLILVLDVLGRISATA